MRAQTESRRGISHPVGDAQDMTQFRCVLRAISTRFHAPQLPSILSDFGLFLLNKDFFLFGPQPLSNPGFLLLTEKTVGPLNAYNQQLY